MSAERFFESFETFKDTDSRIKVLIAADREKDLVFQRLTLDQDVSKEFKEDAFNAFTDGENFRFAKYEPGYKPEDDEICYLPLNESEDVKKVVEGVFDAAKNFNSIELFKGDDEIIDNLRFYVVIVDGAASRQGSHPRAVFFRTFTPKNELAKGGWKAFVQGEDYFNRLKKKVFIFDEKSDCLVWNGYAFIQSITDFQRIFRYFEALQAKAAETIKLVTPRLPILNLSDFTAACLNNPIMLSKLAQISKKEYLASMTMDDIKQTIGLQTPLQNQDRWERREVGLREKPLKEMDHSETTRRRLPWINNDEAEICILIENPDVAHITR